MFSVELDIFSGRPNPSWILSKKEEIELIERVLADKSLMLPVSADTGGLGYRGYIVTALEEPQDNIRQVKLPSRFRVGGNYDKDKAASFWLLDTSEKPDTEVDDYLREVAQKSILQSVDTPADITPEGEVSEQLLPDGVRQSCTSNYFTSSTDFTFWNGAAYQPYNKCYNFASNKRTNTRAQPGLYAGKMYTQFTCSNVAAAIVYDGWRNNCQYSNNLSICLVIWPGTDFHFYRLCSGSKWCHKPGTTPARNTDDSGQLIYNPEACNRKDYTDFCGYWYVDNSLIQVR